MSRPAKDRLPPHPGSPAPRAPIISPSPSGKASPPEVLPRHRWLSWTVCLFLALAVWAVFGRTLRHEFINYDDNGYVYENPAITQGLSWGGVLWAFTHINHSEWFPLTSISHMLDCQLYGLNAGGHHLTNVLLHAATAILLFLVLRDMTGAFWRSAFVAALFAIHPLRVESVAWVTERKDVLSGLFFVLTLGAYVRYVRRPFKPGRYLLVLGLFSLGLLCKAMVVTLPLVLLLLDYWPLGRWPAGWQTPSGPERLNNSARRSCPAFRALILEKTPLLLLAGAGCAATWLAARNAAPVLAVQGLTLPYRLGNALAAYVDYLGHMLYPVGLAVLYPHPRNALPAWEVGWSVLVLSVISAGVAAWRRKCPYLLVGWLWYLGMLVPVIDNLQAGDQARADRYTYLPQIGLYIMAAWGAVDLCGAWRYRRLVLPSVAAAILGGLMAGAYVQSGYWKNSISLWTRTLACTSGTYMAHFNLANALAEQGKLDAAIEHYERALQLKPDYAQTHNNIGKALADRGKPGEAIQHYERAIQLKPDYAEAHNNLGVMLARQGKLPEAIQHYERALQLRPDYAQAHNNLGLVLARQDDLGQAIQHYKRALQLRPDYAEAHDNLGNALSTQGKFDEAVQHCERAVRLSPGFAQAHYDLGKALAGQGKLGEAAQHYKRALQLKPDFAEAHNNLGLVLARQGELPEAIQHYKRALELKPDFAEVHNNLGKVLGAQGMLDEAVQHCERAVQLKPDLAEAHNNLGTVLARQGKLPEAIQHYERALQLKADFAEAHNNLGIMLAGQDKLGEAVQHYKRALELKPDFAEVHNNLGDALASQGKLDEAIRHFQQALNLATVQNNPALAEVIRARLKSPRPAPPQPQGP